MSLRIKCPACQRQFSVGEELQGRMVECGGCEKQFVVEQSAIVSSRDRFFPGDNKKTGLDHYGRAPEAGRGRGPVQFATATYDQRAKAADVIPPSPQRSIATALGVVLQLVFVVVLLVSAQADGAMREMPHEKRIILAGFIAFVGASLIFYGAYRRRLGAIFGILVLAGLVMALAVYLPSDEAALAGRAETVQGGPVAPETTKPTELEVQERVGYGPVEKAIATFGYESVVALWIPSLKASFKYQVQRYLHRKTGTGERPSIYNREGGGLIVIEGTRLTMAEVERVVERFATVDEVYPNIRMLKISIQGERLIAPSPELESKLNDSANSAFYRLNEEELNHIDIDRVREAARRLAGVAPKTRRPQILERLVQLLDEDPDMTFRSTICDAIMVWSEPGDGAEQAVARLSQELLTAGDPLPRSLVEFLIARKSPEALTILEALWLREPVAWEPMIVDYGREAESMAASHLDTEDRNVKRSVATILKRVGTEASLPALRKARDEIRDDEEMQLILDAAIESLESE